MILCPKPPYICFFFFNDTATTEIYTLSLHDALPIYGRPHASGKEFPVSLRLPVSSRLRILDRKSTRLNSSHSQISYAVFCLKKKKKTTAPVNPTNADSTASAASLSKITYSTLAILLN